MQLQTRFCAALLLASLLLWQLLPAQEKSRPCPEPTETTDVKFRPGQVWQYKTRPHEEGSTVTILKVESVPKLGTIVHVRVDGIRLRNCTGGPESDKIGHMPFTRDAMDRSVTKLVKDGSVPDFQDGYEQWRKDCGGAYTITVAEVIKVNEETFRKNLGCEN